MTEPYETVIQVKVNQELAFGKEARAGSADVDVLAQPNLSSRLCLGKHLVSRT
jgi:hypothetical protein